MDRDLRIPVTLDQKRQISTAASRSQLDVAAWARSILLRSAGGATRPSRKKPKAARANPASHEWLLDALEADEADHKAAAIDLLYDNFDRLLADGHFDEADALLKIIPTDGPSLAFLMAVLSITLPATRHLPSRPAFFERVSQACIDQGRNPQSLLGGLRQWSDVHATGPRTK